jgi:hypothetical protein
MRTSSKPTLGVDIGGVILDFMPYKDTELGFDGDRYLEVPEVEGSFEALAALNKGSFKDSVHLVTKIDRGSTRTLEWLRDRKFFERTGIPEANLHICYERSEKEGIVAKLGVTHFIDDRTEVMSYMIGTVPDLYIFQNLNEDRLKFPDAAKQMTFVQSWKELLELLG